MKFMKKLLSTMTAAAIGLSMTTALSVGTSVASAADKTAVQMVEDMGLGWNLGNALDSTNTWTATPLRQILKLPGATWLRPKT